MKKRNLKEFTRYGRKEKRMNKIIENKAHSGNTGYTQ